MKNYYYAENDQQLGPFTVEELKSKRLRKSTLVWTDGMQDWVTADSINELQNILISEPPPLPKKNITPPEIETIQIKKVPSPATSTKYDLTYKKETYTTFFGVLLLVVPIIINLTGAITFETVESYNQGRAFIVIGWLVLRIAITVWVVNIASRQNRNSTGWRWFALSLPSIALIIIGLLKKLRLKIEIDGSLPTNEQVAFLFEKANKLFAAKRYSECLEILNKAIEIDSKNYDCIKLRGLANYHTKNYDKSNDDFKNLIKNEKFLSVANFYLGNIALNNFNREMAIEFWLKAKKYDNMGAEKNLDMYYTFTKKYLIQSSQLQRKLGPKFEKPFINYGLAKYKSGLPQLDHEVKHQNKKVHIFQHNNGIDIELRKTFKSIHIAVAFYEIENITHYETKKHFELVLVDKNILKFSYDQTKDYEKGLNKLCDKFNQTTGKTSDAVTTGEK